MITAVFTDNSDYARATGLWQWNYGQKLRIEGLRLPTAVEIHFALTEFAGDAITRVGTTKDGVTEVVIPDSLLEHQAAGVTYEIYAWIYLTDKTFGETIKRISMQVKRRPKPEGFDTPEDAELFREAIAQVNASADRAETAREGAETAQKAAEEAANKIESEISGSEELAKQVKKDAEAVAKDKQAVSQLATETAKNAQKAAESAQAAERSSTAAKEAQAAAENAEAGAESAMKEVERDRTEVSEAHRLVEQLRGAVDTDRQAVAADRRAVENTVTQFGQFAQSAINAVGQAQDAAVGAVSAEGQRQTTAVQQAGTQAVSDVTAAKTEAVQAVTTEGDTQTKRVQDAAAGIVADREQIAANKAGIEALHQGKADAIIETAQGETMTLTDSSDKLFRGLRVFGKSTQVRTTGAQLLPEQAVSNYFISLNGDIVGKNNSDYSKIIQNTENTTYYIFRKNVGTRFRAAYVDAIPTGNTPCTGVVDDTKDNISITVPAGKVLIINMEDTKAFDGLMVQKTRDRLPYEPYTGGKPSPSPEYPQEIVSAGESGTINVSISDSGSQSQSLTLATPNGLPGVPVSKDGNYTDQNGQQWVCDEVDLGRGKYMQRVLKTKPNKTIVFTKQYDNGRCESFIRAFNVRWANGDTPSLSTIAPWSKWAVESEKTLTLNADGIYYRDSTKTLEEINAIFAKLGTNIEFCGVLDTPTERDLTPEEIAAYEALHTNYPTTVITNDAGAHMEISYVADTGTYIRNMESRLNAKLVNIQQALISQKISGGGIKVTDSSRVPVVRFVMWGKTEQVRTTGAQLLRNDLSKKKTAKGITIELNNCMVSYKGTFVDNGTQDRPVLDLLLKKDDFIGKTLFLVSDDSKLYQTFRIDRINGEHEYDVKEPIVDETIKEIYARFFYRMTNPPSGTVINETHKVMLCESKNKEKPWEPYTGGFPSPSPDWEQPIEITDQPVTVTIKGGTEQQSITLIPPRPFTKWDKLEKVDGVWCWAYQSEHILSYSAESITGEYFSTTGELSAGAEVYYKADVPENIPLSPSEQAQLNAITMYAGTTEVTNTGGCNMELTYTVDTKSYVDSKIAAISAAVLEV